MKAWCQVVCVNIIISIKITIVFNERSAIFDLNICETIHIAFIVNNIMPTFEFRWNSKTLKQRNLVTLSIFYDTFLYQIALVGWRNKLCRLWEQKAGVQLWTKHSQTPVKVNSFEWEFVVSAVDDRTINHGCFYIEIVRITFVIFWNFKQQLWVFDL